MDRRIVGLLECWSVAAFGCAVMLSAVMLSAGCAKEDGSQAPSVQAGPAKDAGSGLNSGAAQTHRPVIDEPAAADPGSAFVPATSGQPPLVESHPHPAGETPRSAFIPSGSEPTESAEPTFSAASSPEFNPLRIDTSPAEAPNPLRSFAPVPRMSAPPDFAPEAGTSIATAPPPAAADPEEARRAAEEAYRLAVLAAEREASEALGAKMPAEVAEPATPYEVVQVFYGTDRAAIDPAAGGWMAYVMQFLPAGFCLLVTLCLLLIAASKRSTALWVLTAVGVLACVGLGYQAAANTLLAIRWDGKQGPQYTIDRAPDGQVQLGVCEVTIPRTHSPGELESPSVLRLEVREDAAQHVILSKTEPLGDDAFHELLRRRVQASPRKELFVFIHGFDTQFEDAARRTAQIHYDLHFQGAPVFFSWPANNKSILTYPADENTIGWSAPHLKAFLLEIVQQSKAQSINLIAHSMGSRAMSIALREIELEFRGDSRLFNHVVLAAPDIDADEFRTNIAPAMQRTANHVTLYASSRDDALRVSQLLHRGARAGDSGRGLVVLPGMDTIDVTAIDTSPWGHIYLGASDPVLQDLKHLFLYGFPPQERRWLSPAQREGLTYWIFEATQTAARGGLAPR